MGRQTELFEGAAYLEMSIKEYVDGFLALQLQTDSSSVCNIWDPFPPQYICHSKTEMVLQRKDSAVP